jgi:hypothetical protein
MTRLSPAAVGAGESRPVQDSGGDGGARAARVEPRVADRRDRSEARPSVSARGTGARERARRVDTDGWVKAAHGPGFKQIQNISNSIQTRPNLI